MRDYLQILEDCSWSLMCGNGPGLDDSSVYWEVIGYFQGVPHERVIGFATEHEGPKRAVDNALEVIEGDSYASLYEYKRD